MEQQHSGVLVHSYAEPGFQPLQTTETAMIAALNYLPQAHYSRICTVERHHEGDESFLVVSGHAQLLTVQDENVHLCPLAVGSLYTVPAQVWHALIMDEGARCFVIRTRCGRRDDVEHKNLTAAQKAQISDYFQQI